MQSARVLAVVATFAAIGCGDGRDVPVGGTSPTGSSTGGGSSSSTGAGGSTTTAYPSPPYGNMMGDTLPPLQWEGYVSSGDNPALDEPWGDFSTDGVRQSGASHALIHLAGLF